MNKKPVIVLVEDEPMELLQLVQTLQQHAEYELHQALNAAQAMEICDRVRPDIIISDYSMPGETGFDLGRLFRPRDQFGWSRHKPSLLHLIGICRRVLIHC